MKNNLSSAFEALKRKRGNNLSLAVEAFKQKKSIPFEITKDGTLIIRGIIKGTVLGVEPHVNIYKGEWARE